MLCTASYQNEVLVSVQPTQLVKAVHQVAVQGITLVMQKLCFYNGYRLQGKLRLPLLPFVIGIFFVSEFEECVTVFCKSYVFAKDGNAFFKQTADKQLFGN